MKKERKTVLVFGTFDGLHMGHEFFLNEAGKLGDELVVAVARDSHVRELKNKNPVHGEQERLQAVAKHPGVARAMLCDETLGSYDILEQVHPTLVAVGHDQQALRSDVEKRGVPVIEISKMI